MRVDRSGRTDTEWFKRILILWEEDDARPPGREMSLAAFKRISGREPLENAIAEHDGGDWFAQLMRCGWVIGSSYDGGFVGCVVEDLRK